MKLNYQQIKDLKEKFLGINLGFQMLDLFLDSLKNKNNKINDEVVVYDYRDDTYIVYDYAEVYNFLQKTYEKFLIKNRFSKYGWYLNFQSCVYKSLNKNMEKGDLFCDSVIQVFTKFFILLSTLDNKMDFLRFRDSAISLFNYVTGDYVESQKYVNLILNFLIKDGLLIKKNDYISFNDNFIHFDFWSCSFQIVPFYSKDVNSIKYGCGYGMQTLFSVIDYYLSNLVLTEGFVLSNELFNFKYKESFAFVMNYEDSDISKVPQMDYLYNELFGKFFVKKLILNEYCFHTVIMSCFESYLLSSRIKNILMDKNDPRVGLRSDFINVLIP